MKVYAALLSMITFLVVAIHQAQAQNDLVYVAVDPCRIVDTRTSAMGFINGDTSRNFYVYGTAEELAGQGVQGACPNPRPGLEPVAVAAYVVATPGDSNPTNNGVITAYPAGGDLPPKGTAATLNFDKGDTIGNTSIVTLCEANCPPDGSLAVLVRETNYNVVIDVQGYFYANTDGVAFTERATVALSDALKTSVANLLMTAPQDGFVILNWSAQVPLRGLQALICEIVEAQDKIPQTGIGALQDNDDSPGPRSQTFAFTAGYSVPQGPLNIGILCQGDQGIAVTSSLTANFSGSNLTD